MRNPSVIVCASSRLGARAPAPAMLAALTALAVWAAPACIFDLPEGVATGGGSTSAGAADTGSTATGAGAAGGATGGAGGGRPTAGETGGGAGCPVGLGVPDASNALSNSSFEDGSEGWSDHSSAALASVETQDAWHQSHVARVFNEDDETYGMRSYLTTVRPETAYTARAWVRTAASPGKPVSMQIVNDEGTVLVSSEPALLGPCFEKIEVPWTAPPAGDAGGVEARVQLLGTEASAGETFDADLVELIPSL